MTQIAIRGLDSDCGRLHSSQSRGTAVKHARHALKLILPARQVMTHEPKSVTTTTTVHHVQCSVTAELPEV